MESERKHSHIWYLENKKLIFAFIKGIKEGKKENEKGS